MPGSSAASHARSFASWIAGRRFPADKPLIDVSQAVPGYPPPPEMTRHLAELPYFARNVAIKALVLAGRRGWAERIGLDPAAPWPY